jgi:hypothetical protein
MVWSTAPPCRGSYRQPKAVIFPYLCEAGSFSMKRTILVSNDWSIRAIEAAGKIINCLSLTKVKRNKAIMEICTVTLSP